MIQLVERNWQTLAACRSADPDLFFPLSSSGAPGGALHIGAGLSPRPAPLRPSARVLVHLAQRRRLPTQVAEWAGHGVDVLLRIYAKCVVGQDELAKRRIGEALRQD